MKLLIVEGDDVCMEIEDVEEIATVKIPGGIALHPELRAMLCAFFIDGIVPNPPKKQQVANIVRFPNYSLPS